MAQTLVEASRIYLADQPTVKALLGHDDFWDVWLFTEVLPPVVEGTQGIAAVLTTSGNWAAPNAHNTARFPRLTIDVYADPERDADNNLTDNDTPQKIEEAFQVFNKLLHRPSAEVVYYDGIRVLGSTSEGEPLLFPVPDGPGMRRARFSYAVMLG